MVSCAVCGVAPSCWNHWMTWVSSHLRCITVTNLLKIRRYRSPVTVWVRPWPSSDQKGAIMPELLTAHHAVHFKLYRGLSLIRSRAIVAQNRLFWVLTLPSSSKLPLSKGYGPGRQVKFSNLHFFLCAIHTHDHGWNLLKHPIYQILFSWASIWHVQQCNFPILTQNQFKLCEIYIYESPCMRVTKSNAMCRIEMKRCRFGV